jgi:hypothetical protein
MGIEHQHQALILARYCLGLLPLDVPVVKVMNFFSFVTVDEAK